MTVALAVAFGLAFYGLIASLVRETHAWLSRRSPIDRLNWELARARARRRRW
jgi:hypothetical protein